MSKQAGGQVLITKNAGTISFCWSGTWRALGLTICRTPRSFGLHIQARTIIKADSGCDPSLDEGMAISINLRGPCLLTRTHLVQMTLDQHFDLNKVCSLSVQKRPTGLLSCRSRSALTLLVEFNTVFTAAGQDRDMHVHWF